ncbi:MAG: GNAT family N-acetyltransferase [Nitrospirae bacterium]|nr:GNAT family N-acetyltransferase [Nitrospirota bacterium]MDA8150412.1 GNAT family N-acetyltransferase [Nitrospiraceae bacterium]
MGIAYRVDAKIDVDLAIDLYHRSTLGKRRPVGRPDIFEGMLTNASLTVSAWNNDRLVGIARTLTDFTYVAYLADLAVDVQYQRRGIGKALVRETRLRLAPSCTIVLFAAPDADSYYAGLGFVRNTRGWVLEGG